MTHKLHLTIPLHGDPEADWQHMRVALSSAMASATSSNHSEALRAIYDALGQNVPDELPMTQHGVAPSSAHPQGVAQHPVTECSRAFCGQPAGPPYGRGGVPYPPPEMTDDQRRLLESVRESNRPTPVTGPGMMVSADSLIAALNETADDFERQDMSGNATPGLVAAYSTMQLGLRRLAKHLGGPVTRKPEAKTVRNGVLEPYTAVGAIVPAEACRIGTVLRAMNGPQKYIVTADGSGRKGWVNFP
jgi:hypothetical protein